MPTDYPGAIDSLVNPTASDTLDSVPHDEQHANANDAIEAIETELGTAPSGAFADVAARLDDVDTTLGSVLTSPLTADLDADGSDIYGIDQLGIGGAVLSTATIYASRTVSTASQFVSLSMNESITLTTGGAFTFPAGVSIAGTWTVNGNPSALRSIQAVPTIAGSASGYAYSGLYFAPIINTNVTSATLLECRMGGTGTPTTSVGLSVTNMRGSTIWALNVGDYQSYHHGKLTLGATTAPTYALDIKGTTQDRGVIALAESSATPTNPSASAQALLYMKADKLVIGYLDGATMRYKYLDLTGTGVTWVATTTAP